MRPSCLGRCFTALLLGSALAGCKSSSGANAYPSDPLLVSKKPVEVKAKSAALTRVASADTVLPPARLDLLARSGPPGSVRREHPTTDEPPMPERLYPVGATSLEIAPASPPTPRAVRASSAGLGE